MARQLRLVFRLFFPVKILNISMRMRARKFPGQACILRPVLPIVENVPYPLGTRDEPDTNLRKKDAWFAAWLETHLSHLIQSDEIHDCQIVCHCRIDPMIRVRDAQLVISTLRRQDRLRLCGGHVQMLEGAAVHVRRLIASLDSGDAPSANWSLSPDMMAAKKCLCESITTLEQCVMRYQVNTYMISCDAHVPYCSKVFVIHEDSFVTKQTFLSVA